jgi:hypothetical protein
MKKHIIIEDGIKYIVIEYENGNKFWHLNDQLHRENGPTVEYSTGDKFWFKYNKCHREDGPAIIYCSGKKEYSLNDKLYKQIRTDEEWIEFQNELIIKEIIE